MKKLAVLLVAVLVAAPAFAENGILKLSLWDNIAVAVPNNIHNITGLDLGIASKADTVDGIQWDFIYNDVHKVRGIKSALFYTRSYQFYGIQSAFLNISDGGFRGLQAGIANIAHNTSVGVQLGIYNKVKHPNPYDSASLSGLQVGIYNEIQLLQGLQLGIVNNAHDISKGLQLGFVNNAHHISKGLQVGLVNIAKNGWFPMMVFVNGRF